MSTWQTMFEPPLKLGAPVRVIQYGKRWVGRVMGWHKLPSGKLRYSVHRDGDIRNHNVLLRPQYVQSIWDPPPPSDTNAPKETR
jgi:hypothetical protein